MITSVVSAGARLRVRGIAHDNGQVASVRVNGQSAKLTPSAPGLVEWETLLDRPRDGVLRAAAADAAGNREVTAQALRTTGTSGS